MKWSQAICASILVDEFYILSRRTKSQLRSDLSVTDLPLASGASPGRFFANRGLPPKPAETAIREIAS